MASEIPRAGLELIRLSEGLELKPYHGRADPPDVWTYGIGCIRDFDRNPVTALTPPLPSEEEAYRLLALYAGRCWRAVQQLVPLSLSENQAGALLDFAYNEGTGALQRCSLRRAILAGERPAKELWIAYRFSGRPPAERAGLLTRRLREYDLYNRG